MRTIDVHAHYLPGCVYRTTKSGKEWHGLTLEEDAEGHQYLIRGQKSHELTPKVNWDIVQRLRVMDSMGVDMHVLSIRNFLYNYDLSAEVCVATSREINDDISEVTKEHPERFAGLATLPMQDVGEAITELERVVGELGLKGAMIADTVNGRTYDEPEFLPFFQAAEQSGALLFIHQLGGSSLVKKVIPRYHLSNSIGNLLDRTMTFASLVFGGVMDKCPELKICLAHGGGFVCHGIGRMDRGWEVRPEARVNLQQPPSRYLNRFFYDSLTHSEPALRYLINTVGPERVVLGTDWPADMGLDWPVSWILEMSSLTQEEKDMILWKNLERLLDLTPTD